MKCGMFNCSSVEQICIIFRAYHTRSDTEAGRSDQMIRVALCCTPSGRMIYRKIRGKSGLTALPNRSDRFGRLCLSATGLTGCPNRSDRFGSGCWDLAIRMGNEDSSILFHEFLILGICYPY